jgi:hypothetical protein
MSVGDPRRLEENTINPTNVDVPVVETIFNR